VGRSRLTLAAAALAVAGLGATMVLTTRGGAVKVVGDPVHGRVLFKGYCSECHTLAAAGATNTYGPNLDRLKPAYARVVHQIVTGGKQGVELPPNLHLTFGPGIHTFSRADIHDLAAFVFRSTHG
jgi:mono/diheme cytochrome c family protein